MYGAACNHRQQNDGMIWVTTVNGVFVIAIIDSVTTMVKLQQQVAKHTRHPLK